MSSNSTKSATTTRTANRGASAPLRRRSTGSAKNANNGITSESIAADLAAFRKQGGRVEVLGNTPIRPRVNATAFRSRGNTARKAATKTASTGTKG
ncbi:hypothetical protein [Lysobacter sp. A03]|uniref:hypothetical protein n=1 Tax=Lysobacter sp. A03 TaxID=1199154 RepID=UPI0005B6C79F|nr:hypothetical protein [Lysobacter sp. A03]KIQ97031.1 hypothetical protein TI01_1487 [Lysobacter sp. A03]